MRQPLPSFGGVGGGHLLPFGEVGWGFYSALSTCSLICSNSSFIWTTMFCISAWLDFEPVVLISRPISPHLLGDETELLALTMTIGHGLAEILQMVCQALLFLADVEFLDIIDELLL